MLISLKELCSRLSYAVYNVIHHGHNNDHSIVLSQSLECINLNEIHLHVIFHSE